MDDHLPDVDPAASALRERARVLREGIAAIHERIDYHLRHLQPELEASFDASFGSSELERLEVRLALSSVRRAFELLVASIQRGVAVTEALVREIEAQVEAEHAAPTSRPTSTASACSSPPRAGATKRPAPALISSGRTECRATSRASTRSPA